MPAEPRKRLWSACFGEAADDLAFVEKAVKRARTDFNAQDSEGASYLHVAAENNQPLIVRLLLSAGAYVNIKRYNGETPAYRAAQEGGLEALRVLIEHGADLALYDNAGITPLHAAASGGSVECIELLLSTKSKMAKDQGRQGHGDSSNSVRSTDSGNDYHDNAKYGDIANPRNSMSMTPCHLARSVDVTEVLYNYGADLSAQDSNGRSPLFVACAMNREPCADYIINCLDREGKTDEIYDKDRRGDTALHAAACNGAVDCLLLSLQYGVDPTVGNSKNLKAIDLAARNNHVRCRDVLAEYHLHFCTSSEFDSVLFLATLQGHRRVKEEESEKSRGNGGGMPPATEDEGSYSIIKKKSFSGKDNASTGGGVDAPRGLKHVQSMFSLKTQKSLRVQRWGEWIAYEDQQTNHIYWYNHSKGGGQWEKPEEVAQMQLEAALDGGGTGGGDGLGLTIGSPNSPFPTLSPKKSMRLRKHGDWIEYVTETSQTFFYNEKNGEFQWTAPRVSSLAVFPREKLPPPPILRLERAKNDSRALQSILYLQTRQRMVFPRPR